MKDVHLTKTEEEIDKGYLKLFLNHATIFCLMKYINEKCLSYMLQYVVDYPMSFCLHFVVIQRSDATTVPTL